MFTTLATCDDVRSQMIAIEAKYFPGSDYYDRLTFAIEVVEAANLDEWMKEAFEVEPRQRMREWIINTNESDLDTIWNCCLADPDLMEDGCIDAFILLLESLAVDRPQSFDLRFISVLEFMESPLRIFHKLVIDAAAEFAKRPDVIAALKRLAMRLVDLDREYVQRALEM